MRIATNEELALINGSSQKLSKNQLKKLYDHGGILTPKDWATMIDNVAQDEIPIYTADELYDLSKNRKLIPENIYYTEYYGEFRSENIHTNLSKPDIICLRAISNSKFDKGYDFRGRRFNIEFYDSEVTLNGTIYKPTICKGFLNTKIESTDSNNNSISVINRNRDAIAIIMPKLIFDEEVYYKASILTELSESIPNNHVVDITNGFLYLKTSNQTGEGNADIDISKYTISRNESASDEYKLISYNIQLHYEPNVYYQSKYIIQLLDIIDENNNYYKDVDYGTSCSLSDYETPEFGFLPFYQKCINNSSYNNIKGDNILLLDNSNNNIIDNSEFWGYLCDNNNIVNSMVRGIPSNGYEQNQPNMYMSNCIFNNCGAYLYNTDVIGFDPVTINKTFNINNIHFNMSSRYIIFSFYNCVRLSNSPNITINSTKTITIGDPDYESYSWNVADY